MRYQGMVGLLGLLALLATVSDSSLYGQRRGGGGGRGVGPRTTSSRGGTVVGPYGGRATGSRTTSTAVGPGGRAGTTGSRSGSATTKRGATVDYAGAGGKVSGPGGTAGRGVGGVQVTGPGGQTATKVGRAGGAVSSTGTAAGRKGSVTTTTGPRGTGTTASRGGVAIGPGGAAARGGKVGVASGPRGTAVGVKKGAVAVGPYGGLSGYKVRGGAAVAGHRTVFVSSGTLQARGVHVRRGFVHYNTFTRAWYTTHPNAWRAAAWTAATFWVGATWSALASANGYPSEPVAYDYGGSTVYEDGVVYTDGEQVATADEYAQQATQIAGKGQEAKPTEKEEWTALGVFGMIQGEETDANNIFQLAINKEGILRGNYYNALSDTSLPVYGSVDKKTQRAAWIVGDKKETVYETGIANLTQAETTLLVHFGKQRTQQWMLVRLEKPEET